MYHCITSVYKLHFLIQIWSSIQINYSFVFVKWFCKLKYKPQIKSFIYTFNNCFFNKRKIKCFPSPISSKNQCIFRYSKFISHIIFNFRKMNNIGNIRNFIICHFRKPLRSHSKNISMNMRLITNRNSIN